MEIYGGCYKSESFVSCVGYCSKKRRKLGDNLY
jgi:hypothetical protein